MSTPASDDVLTQATGGVVTGRLPAYDADVFTTAVTCLGGPGFFPVHSGRFAQAVAAGIVSARGDLRH